MYSSTYYIYTFRPMETVGCHGIPKQLPWAVCGTYLGTYPLPGTNRGRLQSSESSSSTSCESTFRPSELPLLSPWPTAKRTVAWQLIEIEPFFEPLICLGGYLENIGIRSMFFCKGNWMAFFRMNQVDGN